MLAQNFMTAADLNITEVQLDALKKTLVLFETDKLKYCDFRSRINSRSENPKFSGYFNMENWKAEHACGTVACIGGTAELISGERCFSNNDWSYMLNLRLRELFQPITRSWSSITVEQAAIALRSYLTTGNANWDEACS